LSHASWPYSGDRIEVRVDLIDASGNATSRTMLVDTGFEDEGIVDQSDASALSIYRAGVYNTGFGRCVGYWFNISIPQIGYQSSMKLYVNPNVLMRVKSIPGGNFQGLVGVKFLRTLKYAGDAHNFSLSI